EGLAAAVDWWRSRNMKHAHVVLSIPSRHCLSAWIDIQGLPRRDREQTLIYRLEAELPIAAEDIVADFVESQGGALGVALPFQVITPWIAGLEAAGMQIDHLVPHAMLLLSGLPAKLIPQEPVNMLLVQHHDLDLIQLAKHGPVSWRWLGR